MGKDYKPNPFELFHHFCHEEFHNFRKRYRNDDVDILLHGGEFNNIVTKAKLRIYEIYPELKHNDKV